MHCITENCKPVLIPKGNTIKVTVSPTINGVPEDFSDATGINATLVESGGVRGIPVNLEEVSPHSLLLLIDGMRQQEGVFDLVIRYLKPDVLSEGDNSRTLRYFYAVKFYTRPVCNQASELCPDIHIDPIEVSGDIQIGVTILPDNVALYDENGDLKLRRNISIPLGGKLLSTFPDGREHLLAATNIYPKDDGTVEVQNEISNPYAVTNTNSSTRPTVEMPSSEGGKQHSAFLGDITGGSSGNTSARGSLGQVNDTLTFPISGIVCLLRRKNLTEIEVFLTAAVPVTVDIFSVHFSPSGLEFVEYDDLTIPANGTLLTQTIGTNVKQIDARVTTEDAIYDIKANHTVDLSECTVTVSRFTES